ncbi:hypothetical protein PR002_g5180 [Phytophthora rubi]|uniref:RxLR effector protein n=1 Tax=Phytophthora rubi TaxID=129364 RepID=A0A6A3NI19_9STRA|nr:hypothetical protein PR002_g5180 [Phytophthora rubi]
MSVACVLRFLLPRLMSSKTSSSVCTGTTVRPGTKLPVGPWRTCRLVFAAS